MHISSTRSLMLYMDEALREYPLPSQTLRPVIDVAMRELDAAAERAAKLTGLSDIDKGGIDGFIFYHKLLHDTNTAPIGIHPLFYPEEGRMVLKRRYHPHIGSVGWRSLGMEGDVGIEGGKSPIPVLGYNNFLLHFADYDSRHGKGEESTAGLDAWIEENGINENRNLYHARLNGGRLLSGDLRLGGSRFKHFKDDVDIRVRQKDIVPPSPEEMEHAKVELADRNILRSVDFHGNELRIEKTPYEAWVKFHDENYDLVNRFCTLYNERKRNGEFYSLLCRSFALLLAKGFVTYPDLLG